MYTSSSARPKVSVSTKNTTQSSTKPPVHLKPALATSRQQQQQQPLSSKSKAVVSFSALPEELIPRQTKKAVAVNRPSLECPICLEVLGSAITTQCGHSFCFHCLFLSTITHCPMCRHPPGLSGLGQEEYIHVARFIWGKVVSAGRGEAGASETSFPGTLHLYLSRNASSDFEADEILQLRSRVVKLATTTTSTSSSPSRKGRATLLRDPEDYLPDYKMEVVRGFTQQWALSPTWRELVEGCIANIDRKAADRNFMAAVEKALRGYELPQGRIIRAGMGKKIAHHHAYDDNSQQQMFFDGGLMWRRAPSLVMGSNPDGNNTTGTDCGGGGILSKKPPVPSSSSRQHRKHLSPLNVNSSRAPPPLSRPSGHLAHLLRLEKKDQEEGEWVRDPFADDDEDDDYSAPTPRPASSQNGGGWRSSHSHPQTPSGAKSGGGGGVQLVTPRGKQWTCLPSSPSSQQQRPSPRHMERHSAPTVLGGAGGRGGGVMMSGGMMIPPLSLRPGSAALNQQDDDLMFATRQLAKLRSQVAAQSMPRNLPPTSTSNNPRRPKK